MMLQRLATGATGVKQARYRRRPTRGSEALVRACAVYTQRYSSIAAVEFRRGFCTLVHTGGDENTICHFPVILSMSTSLAFSYRKHRNVCS